jgi:hypothetical protein
MLDTEGKWWGNFGQDSSEVQSTYRKVIKINKAQHSENWRKNDQNQSRKPIGQFEEQEEDGHR